MQRLLITLLLFVMVGGHATAQEDDFELRPNRRQRSGGIIGGGGGITPMWHFLNTSELNGTLGETGFPQLGEDGLFLFGGRGYFYIMLIPNLRIGGIGYGGGMETTRQQDDGSYRSSQLDVGAGGVTIEYVIPFGRFHIAFGGMLGAGSYTLTLTEGNRLADKTWAGLFPQTPGTQAENRLELYSSFFSWQPSLTFEYELHPFVVLGLTGGYFGGSGSWRLNDYIDMEEMPDFKFESPFIRLGLTFGLFLGES